MCDGCPIGHFKMSSKLQRDFAAYFDKNQETECKDTLTDHTRDVRRAIALLKNPWMIIDIPRQLREIVQPSATVSSSVQTAPKLSDMDVTQPLKPLAQHEKASPHFLCVQLCALRDFCDKHDCHEAGTSVPGSRSARDIDRIHFDPDRRHAASNEALGSTLVVRNRQVRLIDDEGAIIAIIHLRQGRRRQPKGFRTTFQDEP